MNRVLQTLVPAAVGGALVAALGGAFVIGTAVGDDAVPPRREPEPTPVAAEVSCTDLLTSYVDRGVDRVGPWGWEGSPMVALESGSMASDAAGERGSASASAPTTTRQTNEATGTTVQESGVDEPDVVKTDGQVLYRVEGDDLATYDVSSAAVRRLGSIDLPGLDRSDRPEVLLAGDRLVALTSSGTDATGAIGTAGSDGSTTVLVLDVSDPAVPVVDQTLTYDATLVAARLHGDTVRLVLGAGLPELPFTVPRGDGGGRGLFPDWFAGGDDSGGDDALEANREAVRSTDLDDWLPQVSVDGGDEQPVLDCGDVVVPDDEAPLGTTAVATLDLGGALSGAPSSGADGPATGVAAEASTAYASTERIFLAASGQPWDPRWRGTSSLWSFAIDGDDTRLVAAGEVDGTVADRWSLDEQDGVLRVALGPGGDGGEANAVATLTEDGEDLVEEGRVDGIGPGEDLQAVRWFDDLAVLVTFRQTDPLWAVDLSDDADPEVIGHLEIPGFSAYLHPLGEQRMIGVGEGPGPGGWGAQTGLFDVTDLTAPERIALVHHGAGTVALAATDARQLTWLPELRTVLTVVASARSGWVSVLRLGDGAMAEERVALDPGADPADVRTVPLPDGRVVLTTGDEAAFLPVG